MVIFPLFKGRVGRRDFDLTAFGLLDAGAISLAGKNRCDIQTAAFLPGACCTTAAVMVKCLYDRGDPARGRCWMILAWMLLAGNWVMLPGMAVGRQR